MRGRAMAVAGVTFLVLAALVVIIANDVRRAADDDRTRAQAQAGGRAVERMELELDELLATAAQLRRTVDAVGAVRSRGDFPTFARRTADLPVVTSVALEQVVPADRRAAFERRAAVPIDRPLAADPRLPSLVITSALSKEVTSSALWGLDVFVDPRRRAVLRSAFRSRAAQATPPVSGLKRREVGMTLYLPLARRPGMPMGDAIGVSLDVDRLGPQLIASLPAQTQAAIRDGGRVISGRVDRGRAVASRPYAFAGRQWRLSAAAPAPSRSDLWLSVLVGGLACAAATTAFVAWLLGRLRRASDERRALADRIGDLFAHSPLGMLVTDSQHRIIEVNPSMEALVGRSAEELHGRTALEIVGRPDRAAVRQVVEDLTAGRSATPSGEVRLRRADGSLFWAQMTATPQREPDGALSGLLVQVQDIEARRTRQDELRELADRDPLTGTLNRRSFDERLERHVAACAATGPCGAVFVVDLDAFKQVNDVHGHAAGDRMLRAVADALRSCLRGTDQLARIGGDEFAFLLRDGTDPGDFDIVLERVRTALHRGDLHASGVELRLRASVGYACFADHAAADAPTMLDLADTAMYAAKRTGALRPEVA